MTFIHNNILLIVVLLFVLIVIEGVIIFLQHFFRNEDKKDPSHYVSKEKHKQVLEERDKYRNDYEQLKAKYNKQGNNENDLLLQKYKQENSILHKNIEKLNCDNNNLEQKIRELTRDNDELNKLLRNEPASSINETPRVGITPQISKSALNGEPKTDIYAESSNPQVNDLASTGVSKDKNAVEDELKSEYSTVVTMYASFPRTAGSSVYFSDLSDNRVDDSYFEFKISLIYGKATFKPIDFMKIRNYDEAMAAMRTEGAKPNVATTVLEIKSGEAHKEENDWIIDNFATIKLA